MSDLFEENQVTYIELSDGRVGYVLDLNNEQFKNDLKRLGLTYIITTENNYVRYMMLNTLSPEQVYHQMSGRWISNA